MKLAGDDVLALLPEIRARSRAELGRREILDVHVRREELDATLSEMADHVVFLECTRPTPGSFARVTDQATTLARTFAPGYGAACCFMGRVSALSGLAKATRTSLGLLLSTHLPSVFSLLRGMKRRYGLRRSVALDFVIGSMSFSTADQQNLFVCRVAASVGAASRAFVRQRLGPLTAHEAAWVLGPTFCTIQTFFKYSNCVVSPLLHSSRECGS